MVTGSWLLLHACLPNIRLHRINAIRWLCLSSQNAEHSSDWGKQGMKTYFSKLEHFIYCLRSMYVNTPHLHLLQYSVKKIVSKKIASVVCVGDWCDLNITIFCFCWTLWSSGVQLGNLWLDTDYHYIHFLLSCIHQQASECTDSGQDQEFGNTSIEISSLFFHQILASYLKQCESFLMIPLLTLFKQKLFQHQQPTNLIWLSEQHHQDIKDSLIMSISGIKAHFCNWCPSSLFLKDFVHTNFVNIWSGLQRSYKMSQSYVLSNIQTFTWE